MSPLFEARSALFVISADGGEPKAERAARILYDATTNLALGSHDLGDDFLEFDHRTIAKVEAGRLWLEGFERGTRRAYGPILVPAAATKTGQMWGWLSAATVFASRSKRDFRSGSEATCAGKTLMATVRSSRVSVAL